MIESIEWLRIFILHYPSLEYIIIFFGAAFGGEVAMITLAFLSAEGIFPLYPFFVVSFFGTFSSDILWFVLGKTAIANKFFSHRYTNGTVSIITEAVRRVSRGNNFIALLLANFMLASRIVLIMYVSKTNLKFTQFLFYEAIAVTLWLIAVISIGFISGLGFSYLAENLKNLYAAVGFVLLIVLLIIMFQIWFEKRVTKKN